MTTIKIYNADESISDVNVRFYNPHFNTVPTNDTMPKPDDLFWLKFTGEKCRKRPKRQFVQYEFGPVLTLPGKDSNKKQAKQPNKKSVKMPVKRQNRCDDPILTLPSF